MYPAAGASTATFSAYVVFLLVPTSLGTHGVWQALPATWYLGSTLSSSLASPNLSRARSEVDPSFINSGARQARYGYPRPNIIRSDWFPTLFTRREFDHPAGERGTDSTRRKRFRTVDTAAAASAAWFDQQRLRLLVVRLPGSAAVPSGKKEEDTGAGGIIMRLRGGSRGRGKALPGTRRWYHGGYDYGGHSPDGGLVLGGRDKKDLAVRTKSGILMVTSFVSVIVGLKQTGCAILVAFLQWALFREGMVIARDDVNEVLLEGRRGSARALHRRQWGVFWVLGLAVYGSLLVKEIEGVEDPSAWMLSFTRWHVPACAALYVGLLLEFITSLTSPPLILYQLGQLAAAHFACFLVLPSALVSFASRAGLIWFVIPSASVIANDIAAYACGRLFGRTSLIVLSPNKTWEGFIGAALCTSVFGWLLGRCLSSVEWLTTSRNVFLPAWRHDARAEGMFLETVELPWMEHLSLSRGELHAFWIAMLASFVGPFGGFLASGIKRTYGVKDFGDSIPGHGGAGDRFDCQVMLLPLVYFYLKAFEPGLDM